MTLKIVWLPLLLVLALATALGVGLWLCALYVEYRNVASLGTKTVPEPLIVVSILVALGLLVSGAFYFRRIEKNFADVV